MAECKNYLLFFEIKNVTETQVKNMKIHSEIQVVSRKNGLQKSFQFLETLDTMIHKIQTIQSLKKNQSKLIIRSQNKKRIRYFLA